MSCQACSVGGMRVLRDQCRPKWMQHGWMDALVRYIAGKDRQGRSEDPMEYSESIWSIGVFRVYMAYWGIPSLYGVLGYSESWSWRKDPPSGQGRPKPSPASTAAATASTQAPAACLPTAATASTLYSAGQTLDPKPGPPCQGAAAGCEGAAAGCEGAAAGCKGPSTLYPVLVKHG